LLLLLLLVQFLLAKSKLEVNLDFLGGGIGGVHNQAVLVLAEGSLASLRQSWRGLDKTEHVDGVIVVQAENVADGLDIGVSALSVKDTLQVKTEMFSEVGFNSLDVFVGLDVLNVVLQGHGGQVTDLLGDSEGADMEVSQVDGLVGRGWGGLQVDAQLAGENVKLDADLRRQVDD